jgi:hypothetical protein
MTAGHGYAQALLDPSCYGSWQVLSWAAPLHSSSFLRRNGRVRRFAFVVGSTPFLAGSVPTPYIVERKPISKKKTTSQEKATSRPPRYAPIRFELPPLGAAGDVLGRRLGWLTGVGEDTALHRAQPVGRRISIMRPRRTDGADFGLDADTSWTFAPRGSAGSRGVPAGTSRTGLDRRSQRADRYSVRGGRRGAHSQVCGGIGRSRRMSF